jgi:hypothetical protein
MSPQSFAVSGAVPFRASLLCSAFLLSLWLVRIDAQENSLLPHMAPLVMQGDLSAQMVEGIDRFLMRGIDQSVTQRQAAWHRDFGSPERYEKSVEANRARLAKIVGAVDKRLPGTALEYISTTDTPAKVAETDRFTVFAVRWPVFDGVYGEGLLLEPKEEKQKAESRKQKAETRNPVNSVKARVIAIPDADQTPEMLVGLAPGVKPESQFARHLAENGCQVLVPVLISREDTWSGNEELGRFTNQPHREWIYRQAFELGRHIIGFEVEKIRAAVDWFAQQNGKLQDAKDAKFGVAGYGEGGLIAFYSAALETRIDAVLVSGYFGSRQRVWEEPIYRNVFGLLADFGDAEIATLIAPRALIVEHSEWPKVEGPPPVRPGRGGAAPGKLVTPERVVVEAEVKIGRAHV